jgi:protein-S-isoprenylcysteine O-methyltransferase
MVALAVFCMGTVAAGGGLSFVQKPVGVLYLFLWLVWAGMTTLWSEEGGASSYDKNQFLGLVVLGIFVLLPAFVIGQPWEYANFTGPIPRDGILSWIGLAILTVGIGLQGAAMLELRGAYTSRLGVRKGQRLVKTGPYRFVRHPGYLGFILSILGSGLALSSIIGILCVVPVTLFLFWRIRYEERMLVKEFGKEYNQYMKETKQLVPFVF